MTPQEARQALVDPPSEVTDLWKLAQALGRVGDPVCDDLPVALVADLLQMGEVETWKPTTRETDQQDGPFRPFCAIPAGEGRVSRSLLPQDLSDDHEGPIRQLAESSANPFVRSRLFEVLWVRYRQRKDHDAALDAGIDGLKLYADSARWPTLVLRIGRLSDLVVHANKQAKLADLVQEYERLGDILIAGPYPFGFPQLADTLRATLLSKKWAREGFTQNRAEAWAAKIQGVADKFEGDHTHGKDALLVLEAWQRRWNDQAGATATRKLVVTRLFAAAERAPQRATSILQDALQAALDFGLSGMVEEARRRLMAAVQASVPNFTRIGGTFTLPKEVVDIIGSLADRGVPVVHAVRHLAALPGLQEVSFAKLTDVAQAQMQESPFLALVPKTNYHGDGKVTFQARDLDASIKHWTANLAGAHLATVESLLGHFLVQVLPRWTPDSLVKALAEWPHLAPQRAALLQVGAERFAQQDWVSSGLIAVTVYEAVLRDLLRAGGYSAMKTDSSGILMDETLNQLLRCDAASSVLGEDHCRFVEFVLCNPELGLNLRNEVAHGTIRPEALSPTRVLLVWLFIVRLTSFVALPEADHEVEQGTAQATEPGCGTGSGEST